MIRRISDGEKGGGRGPYGGWGGGVGDRCIYTVTTRISVSCLKMRSDESHFNVSLTAACGTKTTPQTTRLFG